MRARRVRENLDNQTAQVVGLEVEKAIVEAGQRYQVEHHEWQLVLAGKHTGARQRAVWDWYK